MPSSRRRFLQVAGAGVLGLSSGCSSQEGGVIGGYEWKVAWPPQEPYKKPSLKELPDLASPKIGGQGGYNVEIYHDLMTSTAGEFFQYGLDVMRQEADKGTLSLIYRDLPLPVSDWSYPVAIAARSVQSAAGLRAFWEFRRRVLKEYRPDPYYYMDRDTVLSAAAAAGAPREQVRDDTESWRFYEIVERDRRRAEKLGLGDSTAHSVIRDGEKQIIGHGSAGRILWRIEEDFEKPPETQKNQS